MAPIYGPAFVAFAGGPGFSASFAVGGVVAWFPLGPGEPFFPWYHHSEVYLRQINVTNVRNINVTNITNVTNINSIHYRYQTTAATAVSTNVFRNAENVQRNMVAVKPEQLARAQVIPHPEVNPTPRAILAGTQATHPPVSAQRPAIVQRSKMVRPGQAPTMPHNTKPPSAAATEAARGNTLPPVNESRNSAAVPRAAANPAEVNRGAPPPNRPALVSNFPPPQQKLPYDEKAPAMEQHPGRPLEPQQKQNLREGKPAGPMHDQEFPQHPAPAVHAPPAHAAPPKH